MPHDLEALAELERRHDGPPPEPLRRAVRLGPLVERLEAQGNTAFFAAMARGQIALVRRRRADGTAYPALVEDLRLYRREWRRWRRRLRTLEASDPPTAVATAAGPWRHWWPDPPDGLVATGERPVEPPQFAVYPPSKTNSAPVTKRDSSEAR